MMKQPLVLVVEDELVLAKGLIHSLQHLGYETSGPVRTGVAAMASVEDSPPDLILMDIKLEGDQDGIHTAEEIRKRFDIPVVYLTAYGEEGAFERAKKTGPYGYLAKPASIGELKHTIDMALYKHDAEIRLRQSETKYRRLFEKAPVGIISIDQKGQVLEVNAKLLEILGSPSVEATQAINVLSFAPLVKSGFSAAFQECLDTGLPGAIEASYTSAWNRSAFLRVVINPMIDEHEVVTGCQAVVEDVTDRKAAEDALRESETRVRLKLVSILEPEGDIGTLELGDVIDAGPIQSLMDAFYNLTNIGVAILDLHGNVFVATGWQDICTRFHRVHPETCRNCVESDTILARGVEEGAFRIYRCKNGMWDIATPIIIGGRHLGNLYLGQFLFDDEEPDRQFFRKQAHRYGFDETEYMAALDRVPRFSRATIDSVMQYYTKMTRILSDLSYGNIKLARSLAEQDRLLASLKQSEERYRSLVENSSQAIFIVQDGLFKYVNPRCAQMSLYSLEDLLSMSMTDLIHPEDRSSVAKMHRLRLEGDQVPHSYSFRMVDRKGDCKWVNLNSVAISWEGRNAGLCFVSDITELKNAEENVQKLERLKAIGDLSSGVAHNFNNILQVIMGGTQVALSQMELQELSAASATLRQVLTSAELGAQTVRRLQKFVGKRKTASIGQDRTFDVAGTVGQAIEMSKPWWKTKPKDEGISITLNRYCRQGCTVRGNEDELFEVVLNLIKNAAEALPDGGEIKVRTFHDGKDVHIIVQDDGIGIAHADTHRIFEPFWTTKGYKRAGMGLAGSHGIVQAHGGELLVQSELGAGSTFTVRLPLCTDEAEEPEQAPPAEMDFHANILVVDDMPDIVEQITEGLGYYGQTAYAAHSGEDALAVFRETSVDVIVCDLGMPHMTGWEVGKLVREICHERGSAPPAFIMLTGWGMDLDDPDRMSRSGVDVILEKPVDITKLLAVIKDVMK